MITQHTILNEHTPPDRLKSLRQLIPWMSCSLYVTHTFASIPHFSNIVQSYTQREEVVQQRCFIMHEMLRVDRKGQFLLVMIALGGTCYTEVAIIPLERGS